jgi:hypothetical protein
MIFCLSSNLITNDVNSHITMSGCFITKDCHSSLDYNKKIDRQTINSTYKFCKNHEFIKDEENIIFNFCGVIQEMKKIDPMDLTFKELDQSAEYINQLKFIQN